MVISILLFIRVVIINMKGKKKMTKLKLRKWLLVLMSSMMLFGGMTAFADGRVDAEKTVSGGTKVLGSAFICESGFWQHQGNATVAVVGKDRDAVELNYKLELGNKIKSGTLGVNGKYFYKKTRSGYFTYVTTKVNNYFSITSR